ncbi:putative ABC transport system permease protein [Catenuloplanes nepalensis]|uniref:ABC transport system permease protein n=1 Tax=Catenuloplanes nepalensis TaxID=587533 RepID=A0ABT9MW94_9ACTN|nr:ABC transporter permease [Catenuloplanes nepalensis]MDP9795719.1 putative ABC transport system permease protein [Catenuloplanes nepalensis]
MLRATIKSLLARKLRLVLSGLAIVLGVMFVSSAFVLTDSLGGRFERLFQTVNQDTAVQVRAEDATDGRTLTDADIARLSQVEGVARAAGDASAQGIVPFRARDGKAVPSTGAPQLGAGWTDGGDLLRVAEGTAPARDTEVALTRFTAEQAGVGVGDRAKIYIGPRYEAKEYTVSGVLEYSGGRPSLSGETLVAFTMAEAQQQFYGRTGVYGGVALTATEGISDDDLKNRVAAAVPAGFEAVTGAEIAEEQASAFKQLLTFVNWFFLGFALIALLVGMFLIFNTFNIIIAQRARELALFRALGAGWGQLTGSVLIEALVVGFVASTLGLLAGIGVAYGLQAAAGAFGLPLPEGGLVVGVLAIVVSYLLGVLMTVTAALIPAIRAASVPPIAAMREVSRPDKPMLALTITGSVFTGLGVAAIAAALSGAPLAAVLIGAGVLLSIIGVALLSPALTRPVAGLIGRLVAWGTAGDLGRRNALRNPRRTSVTAVALMIGVALVSTVTVIGSSLRSTVRDLVENDIGAEVMILTNSQQLPDGREGFDPARLAQVDALPGVRESVAYHFSIATVNGQPQQFVSATDLAEAGPMFALEEESGTVTPTGATDALIDTNTAAALNLKVGDTATVEAAKGGPVTYTIAGVYSSQLTAGLLLPGSAVRNFAGPLAMQGFVALDTGADTSAVVAGVEKIMADYPLVTVGDQESFIAQQNALVDGILAIFYVLLALAVIVAFLGIVNTLVLSIYERTRELGLLRAIGTTRRQVRGMVRVESLLIAVYGCLLGILLGVGLGASASVALRQQDVLSVVTIPYAQLIGLLVAAALAGVLAAILPARRASRLNVLDAIAYE